MSNNESRATGASWSRKNTLSLIAFGVCCWIAFSIWYTARQGLEAEGVSAFNRPLIWLRDLLGRWPGVGLFGGLSVLFGMLHLSERELRLERSCLGILGVGLGLSFLFGGVSEGAGGQLGAVLSGALSGGAGTALATIFGAALALFSVWQAWFPELGPKPEKPASTSGIPEVLDEGTQDGVSAAEAEALLPRRRPRAKSAPELEPAPSFPRPSEDVRRQGGVPEGAAPLGGPVVGSPHAPLSASFDEHQSERHPASADADAAFEGDGLEQLLADAERDQQALASAAAAGAAAADLAAGGTAADAPELSDADGSEERGLGWVDLSKGRRSQEAQPEASAPAEPELDAAAKRKGPPLSSQAQPLVEAPESGPLRPAWEKAEPAAPEESAAQDWEQSGLFDAAEPAAADAEQEPELFPEQPEEAASSATEAAAAEEEALEAAALEVAQRIGEQESAEEVLEDDEADATAELEEDEEESEESAELEEDEEEDEESAELEEGEEYEEAAELEEGEEYEEEDEEAAELEEEDAEEEAAAELEEDAPEEEPAAQGAAEAEAEAWPAEERAAAQAELVPQAPPEPEVVVTPNAPAEAEAGEGDLLFRAGLLIVEQKRVAVSMLQRKFELDFKRATELLDELQTVGLIGPYLGGTKRDILLDRDEWETLRGPGSASPSS